MKYLSNKIKNVKFFVIVVITCLCFVSDINSQTTVTVVDGGSESTTSGPLYGYWQYGVHQNLYLAPEIGASGTITKLQWEWDGSSQESKTIQIYMGNTAKLSFSSTSDYLPSSELTLVFDGVVSYSGSSWFEITLDTPFGYAGENLVIFTDNNDGDYTSGSNRRFKSLNTGVTRTLSYYTSSSAYSVTNQYYSYTDTYVPSLKLTITPPAPPVADFSASATMDVAKNEVVSFTDLTANAATSWLWTFTPPTVTYTSGSSTSQSPSVTFDNPGPYEVSLKASNAYGTSTEVKPDYIMVDDFYVVPSSGTSSITTCGGLLMDPGKAGNYSNNWDGSTTIYPASAGNMVRVDFTSFSTESGYDYVYIYDGNSTSASQVTGSPFSGSSLPGPFTSTASDGSLTIGFSSDVSNVSSGFDAMITCVTVPEITTSGSLSAFSGCSGSVSSSDNFTVSGVNMEAGITVAAPTGYEVSTDNNSFSSSVVVGSSGTISSTTVYVRLTSSASGSPSGNVVCSSTNASSQNVAASGSVNQAPTAAAGDDVAFCNGSSSVLSGSVSSSMLLSESFDGGVPPTGWTTSISQPSYTWASATGGTNMTGSHAQVGWNYSQDEKLITPSIDLNNLSAASLTFNLGISYYWAIDPYDNYDFLVKISTNNGSSWTTIYSDDSDITGSGGYISVNPSIDLASYLGNNVLVSFEYVGNDGSDLYLDEINVSGTPNVSWSPSTGLSATNIANPNASPTVSKTYTISATLNGCTATDDVVVTVHENPVSGTVAVTDLSVSGNSDLTEAIEADQITWTNTGTANGNIEYFYEWTDNSGTSPTGAWNSWTTSNPNVWNANSSGGNMNRTLWVKTVTTSTNGCGTAESGTTWIDVRNCRAAATGATVSAGTVANMPFGETITYTATMDDGAFERFQYQWQGTGGAWSDWSTTNPLAYATDINAGQTLYVRSKITGPSAGTQTCADYSDPVQTFLIDCANTVSADAGSDNSVCNGSSVVLSGSGTGSTVTGYSWSPSTELSSASIAGPTVTSTSSRTYTLTTTHADGCTATDDVVISVDDAPALTSSASVTGSTTCGETVIPVVVSTSSAGSWGNTGQGTFDGSTDASTTFQSNTFGVDMTLTWTQSAGACIGETAVITAKFNQPTAPGTSVYDYVWGGLTSTDWSTVSNWYKWDGQKWLTAGSAPNAADCKVNIVAPDAMCVGTNPAAVVSGTVGDVTIGSSGTMNLGSSTLLLSGNLINNGTLNGSSGNIQVLASTGDQTISGNAMTLAGLTVNKQTSGDLILGADIAVTALTMTKGNILNSALLTLGSGSANPGTLNHTTGIITGEFRRYFPNATGSQMFPVGTSSVMRDVSVNFTSAPGADQYLTASYVTGAPTLFGGGDYEGLPLVTEDGQLIQNYDNEGHWVINPTNDDYSSSINGKAYTISLHMNNISDATDYTKTRIIKSAGSNTASQHHLSWGALTGQSVSGYNGAAPSNSNFAVTATSTGFSVFGAGSDDGDPLPVELVSFTGNCADGVVDVTWTTASEYNSSHFELENSRDGITWDVVYTKDAAGQSTELTEYTYNDVHANGGDNYYRLTQVDIDGTSKTYDVINVSCSQTTSGYFSIFPNPSSGSFQVILNNAEIIGDARMNVVDTKGNIVLSKSLDVKSGINMYVVNEVLAPGIYYVSVQNGDKVTVVLKHSVK
ncbi:T9SS type A sorting domain-containing protein [Crocinitomicaceae bacterium]|nr:T9SS type A sorting domain-containing protein [Crocinitomicaceae bacterium]